MSNECALTAPRLTAMMQFGIRIDTKISFRRKITRFYTKIVLNTKSHQWRICCAYFISAYLGRKFALHNDETITQFPFAECHANDLRSNVTSEKCASIVPTARFISMCIFAQQGETFPLKHTTPKLTS